MYLEMKEIEPLVEKINAFGALPQDEQNWFSRVTMRSLQLGLDTANYYLDELVGVLSRELENNLSVFENGLYDFPMVAVRTSSNKAHSLNVKVSMEMDSGRKKVTQFHIVKTANGFTESFILNALDAASFMKKHDNLPLFETTRLLGFNPDQQPFENEWLRTRAKYLTKLFEFRNLLVNEILYPVAFNLSNLVLGWNRNDPRTALYSGEHIQWSDERGALCDVNREILKPLIVEYPRNFLVSQSLLYPEHIPLSDHKSIFPSMIVTDNQVATTPATYITLNLPMVSMANVEYTDPTVHSHLNVQISNDLLLAIHPLSKTFMLYIDWKDLS